MYFSVPEISVFIVAGALKSKSYDILNNFIFVSDLISVLFKEISREKKKVILLL